MLTRTSFLFALAACVCGLSAVPARADKNPDPKPDQKPTPANFDRLHAMLLPQPGEAKWAELPWLTSLTEARKVAAAEDKPLLIWAAGGGHQLGRC